MVLLMLFQPEHDVSSWHFSDSSITPNNVRCSGYSRHLREVPQLLSAAASFQNFGAVAPDKMSKETARRFTPPRFNAALTIPRQDLLRSGGTGAVAGPAVARRSRRRNARRLFPWQDRWLSLMDGEELKLLLARAFDRAWARYYRPGRVTISPEIARPALANYLVRRAKDGVTEEDRLTGGGLMYLISITPEGAPD